jgi:hypothetical protein
MGHCIQVIKLENIQNSFKILLNILNREELENNRYYLYF